MSKPIFTGGGGSSGEATSNFLSKLYVEWMTKFMILASKRPLVDSDLYDMQSEFAANRLGDTLFARIQEAKAEWASLHPTVDLNANTIPPGLPAAIKTRILKTILEMFKWNWIFGAVWGAFGVGFSIASPMILQQIIQQVSAGQKSNALWFCGLMFLCQVLSSLCINNRTKNEIKVAVGMRTSFYSAIFRKSLLMSSVAKQEYSTGKLMNMLSTDATMIEMVGWGIHSAWLVPIQVVVMSSLIIHLLGFGGLAGIGILVIISASQTFAMRAIFKYNALASGFSDKRVQQTTEMLAGMKIVKLFAWEEVFIDKIQQFRVNELKNIFTEVIIAATFYGMIYVIPAFVCIVAFSVYSALGNTLSADIIFPALSLISLLRGPMMELPEKITSLIEANVSVSRLARFMSCPELDETKLLENQRLAETTDAAVVCEAASFMWDAWDESSKEVGHGDVSSSSAASMDNNQKPAPLVASDSAITLDAFQEKKPFLQDLTFKIPKGTLCAIVGPVGAGKSSLVQALLGEMKNMGGVAAMNGTIAYASQQGWLQNSTLQGNVLFGLEMDRERYNAVISACSLDKDIQTFPNGDLTEVGERGVQLSGGQVARVNLARSMYSDADILLLDDPLAAVDSHVGRHIFEVGIKERCAGKTVVLVTHQLNLLSKVDMIVYMENGRILEVGTYSELMTNNQGLSKLVNEYGISGNENDETKVVTKTSKTEKTVKEVAVEDDIAEGPKTVMMAEERIEGAVAWYHYKVYINLSGGILPWLGIFFVAFAINLARLIGDYWLIWWSEDAFSLSNTSYIGVYAVLGVFQALFTILLSTLVAFAGITAARKMHMNALNSVIRAPMSFFDTNPLGRIVNRFSRDVAEADRWLAVNIRGFMNLVLGVVCILGLVAYATPTVLVIVVLVLPVYYYVQRFYRNASRELKRLENLARSPFFANCAESFNGLATIRAFRASKNFVAVNEQLVDGVNRPTILRYFVNIWVALRTEAFVALICLTVSTMGVVFNISPLLLGLSISYTLNLAFSINIMMHILSEVEGRMNSMERLDHYHKNIPSEAAVDLPSPRPSWPENGSISFNKAEMKYRPDLPPVLKNLTVDIKGGEKVAIVGRTGAGKSSIISALYRLVELSDGSISIDGVDLATVGLRQLRTSLSIIPQAPILFQGTIRSNVDPLSLHDDNAVWTVLEHASLKEYVSSLDEKLEAPVQENGENLSVGQRQLLCLARAMLVKPRILLIDEATASVDIKTDAAIQKALRSSFADCTILCVAHRLLTIIDYTRVLVLKDGEVSEFDTPAALLKNPDSLFTDLVNETGPEMSSLLKKMAGKSFGELDVEAVESIKNN